jgi:hypothetical protein
MALYVARSRSAACSSTAVTCRKVERGVTNVSGCARAVAPRTKIAVGRRHATAGGPPRAQVTARPRRAPQVLGPGLQPRPWGSWNPCTIPADHLSDGPRAPTPASAARRRSRACPPRQTPAPPPWTAPRPTDPPPFDRGRQASNPGTAASNEAEPMERSSASQLAIATRSSLQPPSCPFSELRRARRPTHHLGSLSSMTSMTMVWWLSFSPQCGAAASDPQIQYTS